MDRSDFVDYLSKKLQGYRVRHGEHTWSVERVTLTPEGSLSLEIGGDASRTLAIDLPSEFDPHDSEHLAWLLGWIEHSLE